MKRNILGLLMLLTACCAFAVSGEPHTFRFSESDFIFDYNENGELEISPALTLSNAFFSEDTTLLRVPFIPKKLLIPSQIDYTDATVTIQKRKILDHVTLAKNPPVMIAGNGIVEGQIATKSIAGLYPQNVYQYASSSCVRDGTVLHLTLSPFVYDADAHALYFVDSITVTPNYEFSTVQKSPACIDREQLKLMIDNPEVYNTLSTLSTPEVFTDPTKIQYILITSNALKDAFTPLAKWKRIKGVNSAIYTVEEIDSMAQYQSLPTIQLKIKTFLYDKYKSDGVKYVLLGGDNTAVPVFQCYSHKEWNEYTDVYKYYFTASDLFYVCYNGQFDWNKNKNEYNGEQYVDGVDFTPSLSITRIPVQNKAQTESYLSKLLRYEQNPLTFTWNKRVLFAGVHMSDITKRPLENDAVLQNRLLYAQAFEPYWDGEVNRLYDTDSYVAPVPYVSGELTAQDVHKEFEKGYMFIDFSAHGAQTCWSAADGRHIYDTTDAESLVSSAATIITTNSCLTNAFDTQKNNWFHDPCLSEAFIRNPDNGVIAYLGCSTYGYFETSSTFLGPSLMYENEFYKNLFTDQKKNFGELVTVAKFAMYDNTDFRYFLIQKGLNPIGDPEMPVFIDKPKTFDRFEIKADKDTLSLNLGVAGCRVCLSSETDKDFYKIINASSETCKITELPADGTICITKDGYEPKILTIRQHKDQTVTGEVNMNCNYLIFGCPAQNDGGNPGRVTFKGSKVSICADHVIFYPEIYISKDSNVFISNPAK